AEWERVKGVLPVEIVEQLTRSPLPLGYSAEVWGTFIQTQLIKGDLPGFGHILKLDLQPLAGDRQSLPTLIQKLEETKAFIEARGGFAMAKVLGWQELFASWPKRYSLRDGRLMGSGLEDCAG